MAKKILLIVLATLIIDYSYAQNIPNGDFETWSNVSSYTPAPWITAGRVSRTADAYEGSHAIKLENIKSENSQSFVANGAFGGNGITGAPYDEQPLSMRFWAKYNLAIGDKAQIVALFTLNGGYIASASFTLEGNSADTFGYFSIPIQWQISTLPDSVAVIFSSLELDSNNVSGDGYVIIDDFHFASISTRNKALSNGDFNTWAETKVERLDNWFTTDDFLEQLGGARPSPSIVTKTNMGRSGTIGIELTSREVSNDTFPGVIFTGRSLDEVERPAFKISEKWKFIEGYYQYESVNGDSAFITAALFKFGLPIAYLQAAIITEQSSYTYFAFPITYQIDVVPDSATIFISNANPDNPRGVGTRLLIDDLKFSNQNLGVFDLNFNKLTVYPNPFKDEIRISGIDRLDDATYNVLDATGRVFRSGDVERNMTIDMRDAGTGLYFLQIEGRYIQTNKILLKE